MRTKKWYQKIAIVCAIIMTILNVGVFDAQAVETTVNEEDVCSCGGCLEDDLSYYTPDTRYSSAAVTRTVLPSSVDLSTSPCFPPIGNQGAKGSCAAFATTYYQYTYEVNKLKGVTDAEDLVIYSPTWTYTLANGGVDKGIPFSKAYKVLEKFGCLTLEDLPYNPDTTSDISIWEPNLIDKKREALEISCEYHTVSITCNSHFGLSPVTNINNEKLMEVKRLLNDGKVLTVSAEYSTRHEKNGYGKDSNKICSYEFMFIHNSADDNHSHALTIVGYDDTICCDINGNGTIEAAERGAFKAVNSHGTSDSYPGYNWIMYDALNYRSAVSNFTNDEKRTSAFSGNVNTFRYLDVEYREPNLIAQIWINTNNRNYLKLGKYWCDDVDEEPENYFFAPVVSGTKSENVFSFTGTLLFALSSGEDNLSDLYCNDYFEIFIHDLPSSTGSEYFISKTNIVDDNGNIITQGMQTTTNMIDWQSPLIRGDVNYDGVVNADDADIITDFCVLMCDFSRVQGEVADYNQDGVVDLRDAIAINNYLSQNGLATTEELAQLQTKIRSCLQDEAVLANYNLEDVAEMQAELVSVS